MRKNNKREKEMNRRKRKTNINKIKKKEHQGNPSLIQIKQLRRITLIAIVPIRLEQLTLPRRQRRLKLQRIVRLILIHPSSIKFISPSCIYSILILSSASIIIQIPKMGLQNSTSIPPHPNLPPLTTIHSQSRPYLLLTLTLPSLSDITRFKSTSSILSSFNQ